MSCPDQQTLLLLIDDELEPAERLAAEQHLGVCGACREFVADMRAVNQSGRSALRGMQVKAPARARDVRPLRLPQPLALAAAIAVVLVSVSVWLLMKGDDGGAAQTRKPPTAQPQAPTSIPQRSVPPLMDDEFDRWAAAHREKRIGRIPLEKVALLEPPSILPIDPQNPLQLTRHGDTP